MGDFINSYFRSHVQIARHALGKYIIGMACALHIAWAIIIAVNERALNATPVSILYALLGNNRVLVIVVLVFVAVLAGCFLDMRLRRSINISVLSLFLVPQQIVLWCSAGAGLWATIQQHYADGIMRSWAHIFVDQSPVIFTALLYTIALLESRHPPISDRRYDTSVGR